MQVGTFTVDSELRLDKGAIQAYDASGSALSWEEAPEAQCMADHDCLECLPPDIPGEIVFVPGKGRAVMSAPGHTRGDRLRAG